MPLHKKLKILVAPLDWGLGHTTRCIPIINCLKNNGAKLVLAGNAVQQNLLMGEFPDIPFLPLSGYDVRYSSSRKWFFAKVIQQLPRINSAIEQENEWLKKTITQHRIDGIISDNRFGLYHPTVPSVFITHQLRIQTGMGNWADAVAQNINYRRIQSFSHCWIPDYEDPNHNLSGTLGHPIRFPRVPCTYLGPLSRMKYSGNESAVRTLSGRLLFVISGPEPQRSIFEKIVFEQVSNYSGKVTVVRGLPGVPAKRRWPANVTVYNHLPKFEMEQLMRSVDFIIGRSGYSSVMDINTLQVPSILIPTPGQAEQEYLGYYSMERKMAICVAQHKFELKEALLQADRFSYSGFLQPEKQLIETAVVSFIKDCENKCSRNPSV